MLLGPFIGLYYLSTNFLQASGNAAAATVASTLRQGGLLIPLLYIMESVFGLDGLAFAAVAADGIAVLIAGAMALHHYRQESKSSR